MITRKDWDNLKPGDILVRKSGRQQRVLKRHPRKNNSYIKLEGVYKSHVFVDTNHRRRFKQVIWSDDQEDK